ncbi:MAG: ABC transporter permease [Bacteroidaceae bacterium]
MRFDSDVIEEILITITHNKTRSLLTAFGVFWGIFMLVALIGSGHGLQDLMSSNFKGFAQNSAFIWPGNTSKAYKGFRKGRGYRLNEKDVKRVAAVEGVEIATPSINKWGQTAVYGDKESRANLKGLFPVYSRIEDPKILYGRFINDIDILEKRKVCYIGNKVYTDLFVNQENPCGKMIRVSGIYYRIIGVGRNESGNMNINGRSIESIIIPASTYASSYNTGTDIDLILLTAKKGYKISQIKPNIEQVIKKAHYIHPDDEQAVSMFDAEVMFSMVDDLFSGIRILVWMVGLGTLLAGAIGVSNIMIVTVKERTTEIGIRRAIGATPRNIMVQILSESMVLTIVAGLSGICFAVLVLQGIEMGIKSSGLEATFQVDFWTAIFTAFILLALGLLAGLAPAYRAMAIKPIEAIRDE